MSNFGIPSPPAQKLKRCKTELTAVQVAGDGGMGEEDVVEVGVLLE